ncbi:MAG TPA: phosphoribosyl-AMP cyclohydrolase [Pararhizobium sp.]|nr:phosphoribosyl-AMP cyclohydrolase [Pararhizobium sp.]
MAESSPPPPDDERRLEHGVELTPRFDANGLITAVVTDAGDGELLMLAHMNAEALRLTLDSGCAHFYSRSRKALWKKGESSGNLLSVREIRVDCDQDAIWLKVDVAGSGVACHTGERSCFYRIVARRPDGTVELRQQPL